MDAFRAQARCDLRYPTPDQRSSSTASSQTSICSTYSLKKPMIIPQRVADVLAAKGFEADAEGVVRWRPDSITHPRRWPILRKIYDTALICFLEFFTTMVSNTGSSVAPFAAGPLGLSAESALFCFTTIYLIGQAIGGLLFPPIAENFGGRTIYLTSTFGFAVSCLLLAAFPTPPCILLSRFTMGFFSAIPTVVAASSIENMWDITSRTFAIHTWIVCAVIGLSLGPPFAIFISTSTLGWTWVYIISASVTGALTLLCFGMQESRPSQVLRQQVRAVSKETKFDGLSLEACDARPTLLAFIRISLWLPMRLFFTEPIVFLTSVMAATVVAVIYLFSEVINIVYMGGYGFSVQEASLVMLAIGSGVVFSFLPRLYDIHISTIRRRANERMEPEDKLFGYLVAAPVLAAGLWWFAFTVPPLVTVFPPWVSIASLSLVGFSVVEFDNVLSGYLCDTYAKNAASANAPMALLRALLSGVFPLFGRQVFDNVGTNSALFILAGLATSFCGVAVLFKMYGKRMRERSPIAMEIWNPSTSSEKLACVDSSIPASETAVLGRAIVV